MGQWVGTQRRNIDSLTKKKIERLNELNFSWNVNKDLWNEGIEHLRRFFDDNKHSRVPKSYKTEDRFPLGRWVQSQREKTSEKTLRKILTKEQIDRLNTLNFDWRAKK